MKTNIKIQESGRSMVEMLGVLAIIGVLSVGGIAGYTMAMNKHRANEILNAASVRAVVVSTKLQTNSGADITNALAEFGNETIAGAVFGSAESVGTSQFKIKFTTAPNQTICDQMQSIAGTSGVIRSFGTNCDALTYNNDLTNTDPVPSGPTGNECTDSCGTGATCVNGYCQCETGIWQPSGIGTGSCKTTITNGDCTTNADCESGEYCAVTSSEYDCDTPDTGTCTAIGTTTEIEYNNITFVRGNYMGWWAARNWCLAQGKSMASVSDFGITGGYESEGYCTGSDCTGAEWGAIQDAFGDACWTNNSYDSCLAFVVFPGDSVVYNGRREGDRYALCK